LFKDEKEAIERMENENRIRETNVGNHGNRFEESGGFGCEGVDVLRFEIHVKNGHFGKGE
jgi:hypothetical protein